jgi:hypothetical protein
MTYPGLFLGRVAADIRRAPPDVLSYADRQAFLILCQFVPCGRPRSTGGTGTGSGGAVIGGTGQGNG